MSDIIITYKDPITGELVSIDNRSNRDTDIQARTMDNIEKTFENAFHRSSLTRNLSFAILIIIMVIFAFLAVQLQDPFILGCFLVLSMIVIGGVYLAIKSDNAMTKFIIGSFERLISTMFADKQSPPQEAKAKKVK